MVTSDNPRVLEQPAIASCFGMRVYSRGKMVELVGGGKRCFFQDGRRRTSYEYVNTLIESTTFAGMVLGKCRDLSLMEDHALC